MIAALAALVTACAVLTPLYQRALEQASVRVALDQAPASAGQLHLSSTGVLPDVYSRTEGTVAPLSAQELVDLVPTGLRRSFGSPIAATSVVTETAPTAPVPSQGQLLWRDRLCDHLELTAGRCPATDLQIAVSTADAENFGWAPGATIPVDEKLPPGTPGPRATATLTVVGVYATPGNRYWDGWSLTGASGTRPDRLEMLHDVWLTSGATFAGATQWRNPVQQVDLPLTPGAARIDQLLRVGPAATTFQRAQSRRPSNVASVRVRSDLASIAQQVREGRSQARTTVPLLMIPLGILGLVVLWMALGAAAEQRRPEVAVARLRGRGVGGARTYLLRELLAVVLAGVPVGALLALGLARLARDLVLPGSVPLELRLPVWGALFLATVSVTATTVLVSSRVSREPIAALLRRVPPRPAGWALGTTDAVVLTAAASIVGAFATGRLTGPVALAAPAVLALAIGLVLSRTVAPVATRAGRGLLRRGRTGAGVSLLQLARRPGTRGVVALLTVSASILVFAANAVAVGARNRDLAAAQQVGAPAVAVVGGGTLAAVRDALRAAGVPRGAVTPVVVVPPNGNDAQTNLFVDPVDFSRIAALPESARAPIRALPVPRTDPVAVAGDHLTLRLDTDRLETGGHPVALALWLLGADGLVRTVPLGPLPSGSGHRTVESSLDCATGCTLTGWQVTTDPASTVTGTFTVSDVRTDRGPVGLGAASDWSEPAPAATPALEPTAGGDGGLTVSVANGGRSDLLLQHHWVPTTLPTVVAGHLPDGSSGRRFAGTGLDGEDRSMTLAATIPWLPQAGRDATVTSLDLAARAGAFLTDGAELQLWFARDGGTTLARVTRALQDRHLAVLRVSREAEARRDLQESASAWSLQLGVLAGVACLLVSALGLVIAAVASWRTRTRDLAILRLNGMSPAASGRIPLGEQLPGIVLGGVAGALAGVLAAHFSLPSLPLLPTDPPVDLLDLSIAWGTVLPIAGAAVLALAVLGWLLGAQIARRSTLDRVLGSP